MSNEISEIWAEDSKVNENDLMNELRNIPSLHSKYYSMYYKEALRVKKLKYDLRELEIDKREWLDGSMAEETLRELGWKPFQKKIMKADMNMFIQGDKDIIKLSLRIDYHTENAMFLESIIKTIHSRNFIIKGMIDIQKFQAGEY
tara:strand:- start:13028 stop:13462 length:435 start_codon:yes stop_codon:yes gene_type:complete